MAGVRGGGSRFGAIYTRDVLLTRTLCCSGAPKAVARAPLAPLVALRRVIWALAACCLLIGWSADTGLAAGFQEAPADPDRAGGAEGAGVPSAIPAARRANNVAVITITESGGIDAVTAQSVARRIALAEQAGADALVIEIDTPGGEVGAVLEICNAIKGSSIKNTVAWIHPDAYSGGAIIALACREIIASDPASMGDALPIGVTFGMLNELPEAERQKFLAPLIAEVVSSARAFGWDEYLVQAIVSRHVELWFVEHIETGERLCIDEREYRMLFENEPPRSAPRLAAAGAGPAAAPPAGAPSEGETPIGDGAIPGQPGASGETGEEITYTAPSEALEPIETEIRQNIVGQTNRPILSEADRGKYRLLVYATDGAGPVVLKKTGAADDLEYFGFLSATVQNDEELKAFFGAGNLSRLTPTWSESFVRVMTSLWVRGILLVVFIVGLFLEMSAPGIAAPGITAAVALVLLLAPPYMIGLAGWWEIAAIALGITGIIVEIFVLPGFGVFGILGLMALFVGLLGTFVPDGSGRLFPDSPGAQRDALFGLVTMVLAFLTAGGAIFFISRKTGGLPVLNRLILRDPEPGEDESPLDLLREEARAIATGDEGVADTDLRPSGRAEIAGQLVDVVAGFGYIEQGTPVRVTGVEGWRVTVEPTGGPADGAGTGEQHA